MFTLDDDFSDFDLISVVLDFPLIRVKHPDTIYEQDDHGVVQVEGLWQSRRVSPNT